MILEEAKINVPSGMIIYLRTTDKQTELERNAMLLYPYIKNMTISHGKAAEILGISKRELIELYNGFGLAYFDMDISDIEYDVATLEKL